MVDRPHELVDLHRHVESRGEPAAFHRAFQRESVALALFVEVRGPRGGGERGIVLSVPDEGLEDGARVGPGGGDVLNRRLSCPESES